MKPSWNAAKAEVGGGALGSDTTGAATQDYTAAMRARAKMSLFATWVEGAGTETGAGAGGGGGAAIGKGSQARKRGRIHGQEKAGASSGRGNSVRELVTQRDSWTSSRVLGRGPAHRASGTTTVSA